MSNEKESKASESEALEETTPKAEVAEKPVEKVSGIEDRVIQVKLIDEGEEDIFGAPLNAQIARPKKIEPTFDSQTGRFVVDLPDDLWDYLKETMGSKYDLDTSHNIRSDEPHDFWQSRTTLVSLEPNTMVLEFKNPLNIAKYGIMRGHKLVANSLEEYQQGMWPDALWVIIDDHQDIKQKARDAQEKATAYALMGNIAPDRMRDLLQAYKKRSYMRAKPETVIIDFEKAVEENPGEINRLWKRKDILEEMSMIVQGIEKNQLKEKADAIKFGDTTLGLGIEEAAEKLKEDQELKQMLMAKIENW